MAQDHLEARDADVSLADVLVAVHPGTELHLGIVGVDHDQLIQAYRPVELVHDAVDGGRVCQVVPGCERMLGVQAHLDTRVVDRLDHPGDLSK